MDHTGQSIDIEDLERVRAGLPPLDRKWIEAGPFMTLEEVIADAMKALEKELAK